MAIVDPDESEGLTTVLGLIVDSLREPGLSQAVFELGVRPT